MYGSSTYRMPMPLTVSIEFRLASGANRFLWMTASPIDMGTCRAFWWHGRDDDLDGDDEPYIAFQARVLAEDEPVVCSQEPAALPLDPAEELSVRTDRVSIEYRRFLRDIADAATAGTGALRTLLAATPSSTAVG
jgi:vanillate O-demethylase monooxygenase subunit